MSLLMASLPQSVVAVVVVVIVVVLVLVVGAATVAAVVVGCTAAFWHLFFQDFQDIGPSGRTKAQCTKNSGSRSQKPCHL